MFVDGSYAAPPHSDPPIVPGRFNVPFKEGGVNNPSYLKPSNILTSESRDATEKSERSSTVMYWRQYGFGFNGNGCVGQVCSPGTSETGTGLSSIGNKGSPVSRFSTYRNPTFDTCATASIFFPSRSMVTRFGGAGKS